MDSISDVACVQGASPWGEAVDDGPPLRGAVVSAEIAGAPRFRSLAPDWRGLVGRCAEPNVFMEPAVAGAMYTATETPLHVVLAWRRGGEGQGGEGQGGEGQGGEGQGGEGQGGEGAARLIGAWLLVTARPSSRLPIPVLEAPCHALSFFGAPVLDRDHAVEALSAMLTAIARSPDLPRVICANQLPATGAFLAALTRAAGGHGFPVVEIERRARAWLGAPALGGAPSQPFLSSKRRSELRRKRKQLAASGALRHVSHRTPAEVDAAFQEFLALEAAGWKGRRSRNGRALRNAPSLAAFAHTMVTGLARDGCARIEALRLDGRAIAMNVWLRSGRTAYGWKMAYDEAYARWSPGMLLLETTVDAMFADGAIAGIDSCNRDEAGALAAIWPERRAIVDLVIDLSPGGSARGHVTARTETLFRRGRTFARRTYKSRIKPLYLRALARLAPVRRSGPPPQDEPRT